MRDISPSVLSADFSKIKEQINIVKEAGANRLHLDVMDGNFVPNLTFGPIIIKAIKKITNLHLETHLMINNPNQYIDDYIKAGSDTLIFHYEASNDIQRDLEMIKNKGIKCGIAIKPETSYKVLEKFIDTLDYILIMSVSPGFGGQGFIKETLIKMESIHKMCINLKRRDKIKIGVDGGINLKTIKKVYNTGIDITIVGSALYGANDIKHRFKELMNA
tara:strand:+ start:3668 stop:4321 length:654 start_codon:yes stop_codon:yes gene_type:complete